MTQWIAACEADDIDPEDVIPFDPRRQRLRDLPVAGRRLLRHRWPLHPREDAAVRRPGHGRHHRCPKHNGRFDYTSGKALGAPVLVDIAPTPLRS